MAADRVGQQLGNYRLIHVLGWGGFAEVYLGEHVRLGTRAAIKVLHTHITGTEEDNFLAEARTIAHLEHVHIIRILDFDVQDGAPFLVMGYAPNGSLRSRYPKGTRLPLPTVLSYVQQIAAALQYAHDHKIIHRDIKPENMLIGRDDEIFLSDFGIALIAQSSRVQHIQSVVGTAIYMAPEQLQGKPRIASDQYALAVVVYEWLTGERPFRGTFLELYSQHLTASPPSMHAIIPTLPPQLDRVIQTAMAKDPAQRFENVKAFAAALEQAAHASILVGKPTARLEVHTPLPDVPIPQTNMPIAPVSPNIPASLASPIVITPPRPVPIGTRLLSVSVSPSRSVSQPLSAQPSSTASSALSEELQPAAPAQAQLSRRNALTGIAMLLAGGTSWWLSTHQGQLPIGHSLFKAGAGRNIKSTAPVAQSAQNGASHIPIANILAQDTFQRGDQLFWGIASDSSQWEGDANTARAFSIANATGRIANAQGTFNALLGPVSSDTEIIASVSINAFANGVNCGLVLRWFNDDNWYKALLDGQHLSILRRINGQTDTLKTISFPMQAKRFYKLRFRTIGAVLLAKTWPSSDKVEPPHWQITASDTALMSGRAGLRVVIQPTTTITITSFTAVTAAISADSTE
jgi:serine/threonine protein kinase